MYICVVSLLSTLQVHGCSRLRGRRKIFIVYLRVLPSGFLASLHPDAYSGRIAEDLWRYVGCSKFFVMCSSRQVSGCGRMNAGSSARASCPLLCGYVWLSKGRQPIVGASPTGMYVSFACHVCQSCMSPSQSAFQWVVGGPARFRPDMTQEPQVGLSGQPHAP